MIVCGLDPSLTNTGIAVLVNGAPLLLRSEGHRTPNGRSYNHRSDRIVSQCRAVIAIIDHGLDGDQPDLAVIEGPSYGDNMPSNHDRAGLWWGLYSTLRARKVPVAVVAPKTLKSWATGTGNASKTLMASTVRAWWPAITIRNHDIADAAALALAGAHRLGDPIPFEPKQRQLDALDGVAWPEAVKA